MDLSTRGRYGIRAMIEIAMNHGESPVLLKEIAKRQDLSVKYLDHIIAPLRASGLIARVKGGYILTEDPEEISTLDVLNQIEGSMSPVACVDKPDICDRSDYCAAKELWVELAGKLRNYLKSKSLKDLAKRQQILDGKRSK